MSLRTQPLRAALSQALGGELFVDGGLAHV
jgi:hypothetical protein